MSSPFPGMDPYLEHPALWPDVHNSLIVAIRDSVTPLIAPRYYVALERRTYLLAPNDVLFLGRPDLSVIRAATQSGLEVQPSPQEGVVVLEVEVPLRDEVGESFLEIHEVTTGKVVTILELLSPANKLHSKGRADYEDKRAGVFESRTNLVEIDLLRAGEHMPLVGELPRGGYRILIARGASRPRANLMTFEVRQPIPAFPLPLLPTDQEPLVELNKILHSLYERARFDLRIDYRQPPVPPLEQRDADWARQLVERWSR